MAVTITFNSIVVNSLQNDAGVFIGQNNQVGWDSHSKRLSGVSTIIGQYNVIPNSYVLLNNNNVIDTPILDNDIKFGTEIQQV